MENTKDSQYFMNQVINLFGEDLKKYEPDFDLPYILFGSFALFLTDLIKQHGVDKQEKHLVIAKNIVEEMASTNNPEVEDLFMVGFLEVFADDINSVKYARENFNPNVNKAIDKILKYWNRM